MRDHEKIRLNMSLKFFENVIEPLNESDSEWRPTPEAFSVAEQVAHTAQTIEWFLNGAFSPQGFDMDFETIEKEIRQVSSLEAAREWLYRAYAGVIAALDERSDEEWLEPIVDGPVMGGLPRGAILDGILDHTAHHRGSLATYQRVMGRPAPMPYT